MEELLEFVPHNPLEHVMADAKAGVRPVEELVEATLNALVYVASTAPVQADGTGYAPLLMKAEDWRLVAIFSSPLRLDIHKEQAGYFFRMRGLDFMMRIPDGYGLTVDAGFTHQYFLGPADVAEIRARYGAARTA